MNDAVLYLLWAVVLFGIYRQACVIRYEWRRRRVRRERFRGLRLVIGRRSYGR